MQRLTGHSKSPVGVNVSADGSLTLYEPWDEVVTCPGCPSPSPVDAEIGSSPLHDP